MTTISAALALVMGDVREVRKADRNASQGFNFRGIDAVMNAVGPALRNHQVVVMPEVLAYEYGTVEVGSKRTPMGHARVTVRYTFTGPEGDSLSCSAPGEAMDSGDKATAKAMSVAFRTALLQALCLPTDDTDPDHETYTRSEPDRDAKVQPAKPVATAEMLDVWAEQIGNAGTLADLNRIAHELAAHDLGDARADLTTAWTARKAVLDAEA